MERKYTRSLFLTLLLALLCTGVRAQMTQMLQSFEGAPEDDFAFTASPEPYDVSGDKWGIFTSIGDITSASDGSAFWGGEDLTNPNGGVDDTQDKSILTFDAGVICNLTSAKFVFDYNVKGFNGADELGYTLYIDGFPQEDVVVFEGVSGGISTADWTSVSVNIPGTANTARLDIYLKQDGPQEFGIDNVRLTATGTGGSCGPVCGVSVNPNNVNINCGTFTTGTDPISATIPYSGAETGVTVSVTGGGTVGGDNPATVQDGEILITDLLEGNSYMVTISGGDCTAAEEITISLDGAATVCEPGVLLINEFLADPPAGTDWGEFVELVNIAEVPVDISGYTIEDGGGSQQSFGDGIVMQPGEGIVLYDGASMASIVGNGCYSQEVAFLALNNDGDMIIVRDNFGTVVTQLTYGAEGGNDQSVALVPDRDPAGTYQLHMTELGSDLIASPCRENVNNDINLPLDLLGFTGRVVGKSVVLDWATANEVANAGFTVERFEESGEWLEIGRLSAGDQAENTYTFTDEAPREGTNLYRLEQLDLDGSLSVYGPVVVEFTSASFGIAPNPVSTEMRFSGEVLATDRISLLAADGRLIRELPSGKRRVEVSDLVPGLYVVRLQRRGATEVRRFIKR